MDRNEAKVLLQACRPDGQDDAVPAFAEALAMVERDPELKTWWEAQKAFDRTISTKIKEIPLPDDLRATIVAGRKIEQMTPRFQLPYWLAAAALIMFCLGLGFHFWPASSKSDANPAIASATMANSDYETGIVAFLENDTSELGMMSSDHDKVAAWLKEQNSPVGAIPSKMISLSSLGCQAFAVHGHAVSLICFNMPDGGVTHLFVIQKQALANPPGGSPEFKKAGSWTMATWSDGDHSYMLATQEGADKLKQLL
jgi:hypothetical protein